MICLHLFFWLLVGHALCDFPLQGDFLAQAKNRHTAIGKLFWHWALPTHALIHAAAVTLVTGSYALGLFEFFAHMGIDYLKCENKLTFAQDQTLHIAFKAAYVAYVALGLISVHPFHPPM